MTSVDSERAITVTVNGVPRGATVPVRRLLSDERFSPSTPTQRQVYPRLVVSAVDLALVSGALGRHRDAECCRGEVDVRSRQNSPRGLQVLETFPRQDDDVERLAALERKVDNL